MSEKRQQVLEIARSWCGTPFHSEARLKKVGVDCGQLLLAVYEEAGLIPHVETEHYPADYHLHRSKEWYLTLVQQFAKEIEGPPKPADLALWRFGRVYSHGAIVVEWPTIIHANFMARKCMVDQSSNVMFFQRNMGERKVLFFDAIGPG
jgi:cell wall-associated NlpC family hydrolase